MIRTYCQYFQTFFFPFESNKPDYNIRNSESKQILKFIRPSPNGLMCIILIESNCFRLRVELSHLSEHKFRQNFQDSLDPFCNCGRHIETITHFFLHWSNYSNQRTNLFEKMSNIKRSSLNQMTRL